MSHAILTALGLGAEQSGSYLGQGEWSSTKDAGTLSPVNPATGEVIASVHASSAADDEKLVERAQAAF
jgi:aldehyde dehydrogenase (NAD+)